MSKRAECCQACGCLVDHKAEAIRFLGFALFNLNKGNTLATETLIKKAYVALTGEEWDS